MEKLVKWKEDIHRKPLIIKGVPQCGKTYLIKEFGNKYYDEVLYFDFEEDKHLSDLFEHDLNPQRIIKDLSLLSNTDIEPGKTLIIFDKISTCDRALESLEHFNDSINGSNINSKNMNSNNLNNKNASNYNIIAADSFFDKTLPKVDILTLFPMNFYEFLLVQNSMLAMHLSESNFNDDAFKTFSVQLEELFRDFQIVGGMPEVVQSWIDSKSIETVDKLQSRIISSFESDFAKHAPTHMFPKLNALWNAIPEQLSKENRKFIFSKVKKSWRAKDLEDSLYWLIRAGFVYKVEHIEKPDFPLSSYVDHSHFKLYMCDVGLLRRTARIPPGTILDNSNNFKEIKGALIENIVCCELKRIYEDEIYYWSAENPGRAEVEFVIQDGSDIIPIVAKAGSASRTRSLTQYSVKYKPKKSVLTSMDNDKPDVLPLYAFWDLKEWLAIQYPNNNNSHSNNYIIAENTATDESVIQISDL